MTHPAAPTKLLRIILTLLALVTGGVWSGRVACLPAQAAQSEIAATLSNTVSLVSDVDRVAPGQPFRIGLLFDLGQGWHIYWTNPGDAGAAPTLDMTLPQGGSAGAIQWPIPKVMIDGSVTSYGYSRKTAPVLLPLTVTPARSLAVGSAYTVTGGGDLAGLQGHLRPRCGQPEPHFARGRQAGAEPAGSAFRGRRSSHAGFRSLVGLGLG